MTHEAPTTAAPAPDGDRPEVATPRDEAGGETESGTAGAGDAPPGAGAGRPREIGGRDGPEPTRYGDWEKNGRCIDF